MQAETDQSIIARKRLEERLLKRKIYIQLRDNLHRRKAEVNPFQIWHS
jgi:hypothetical protein